MRSRRTAGVVLALLLLMAAFGDGVYRLLGHFRHLDVAADATPTDPTSRQANLSVQGVVWVSQGGDLYALRGSDFHRVLAHDTGGAWLQPAALTDGSLVVIDRHEQSSDLVHVARDGRVLGILASGAAAKLPDGSLADNHWIFDPHLGADRESLLVAYDSPKSGFLVDFAIWTTPLAAAPGRHAAPGLPPAARRLSTPNDYTGGDVDPVPWPGGGVLFTRYSIDSTVHSQVWWANPVTGDSRALTDAARDCEQPALAPDGSHLAMICTGGQQSTTLVVVPVAEAATAASGPAAGSPAASGTAPGAGSPPAVPSPAAHSTPRPRSGPLFGAEQALNSGGLAAQPAWSPDGTTLAWLAPAETGSGFQLWIAVGATGSSPGSPRQVTTGLGLDATSRPLWTAG